MSKKELETMDAALNGQGPNTDETGADDARAENDKRDAPAPGLPEPDTAALQAMTGLIYVTGEAICRGAKVTSFTADEAAAIAYPATQLMDHYGAVASPVTMTWVGLIGALLAAGAPRYIEASSRQLDDAEAPKARHPADHEGEASEVSASDVPQGAEAELS